MRAHIIRLAAMATMAVGLALGVGSAAAQVSFLSCEGLDAAGNGPKPRVQLTTDQDGEQRAGYMVGRYFVGYLPE